MVPLLEPRLDLELATTVEPRSGAAVERGPDRGRARNRENRGWLEVRLRRSRLYGSKFWAAEGSESLWKTRHRKLIV